MAHEPVRILAGCILCAIILAITVDMHIQNTERVEAREPDVVVEPREVRIEVIYNWTEERIEEEIRAVFWDMPDIAYAVSMAEGGMRVTIQSHYVKNGEQEPSFCAFQIHEPSWMRDAKRLGYGDYKTNPASCIQMARYIYENAVDKNGNNLYWRSWSAYNNGTYLKYMP